MNYKRCQRHVYVKPGKLVAYLCKIQKDQLKALILLEHNAAKTTENVRKVCHT